MKQTVCLQVIVFEIQSGIFFPLGDSRLRWFRHLVGAMMRPYNDMQQMPPHPPNYSIRPSF